jgi:hypothetical protein
MIRTVISMVEFGFASPELITRRLAEPEMRDPRS